MIDYARLEALFQHWEREPPVDAMFAAFVGYKSSARDGASPGNLKLMADRPPDVIGTLRAAFPNGVIRAG